MLYFQEIFMLMEVKLNTTVMVNQVPFVSLDQSAVVMGYGIVIPSHVTVMKGM